MARREIYRDGDVYFVMLSPRSWLRIDRSYQVEKADGPRGSRLIEYPDQGWHTPPVSVLNLIRAAEEAYRICMQEAEEVTTCTQEQGHTDLLPLQAA